MNPQFYASQQQANAGNAAARGISPAMSAQNGNPHGAKRPRPE